MRRSSLFLFSILALLLSFFIADVTAKPESEVAPYSISTDLFHDVGDCGCQGLESSSVFVTAAEVILLQSVAPTPLRSLRPVYHLKKSAFYRLN